MAIERLPIDLYQISCIVIRPSANRLTTQLSKCKRQNANSIGPTPVDEVTLSSAAIQIMAYRFFIADMSRYYAAKTDYSHRTVTVLQ